MAISTPVQPASKLWTLDATHSLAQFSVRHMMISNVRGSFARISGTATFDVAHPEASSLDISMDTASLTTGDEQRDGHLKSADFFDVEKYPTITFKSTKVTADGEGAYKVEGNLTVHGVTRTVVLQVEGPEAIVKDPWGNLRWGATATTKLNRKDFGLQTNVVLETGGVLIGDDVKVTVEAEFVQAPSAAVA